MTALVHYLSLSLYVSRPRSTLLRRSGLLSLCSVQLLKLHVHGHRTEWNYSFTILNYTRITILILKVQHVPGLTLMGMSP